MFKKLILSLLLSIILSGCIFEEEIAVPSPVDSVAYYQEKNRIYWKIKDNPAIINDADEQETWFEAWKTVDPELRKVYINEAIDLYNSRKGE